MTGSRISGLVTKTVDLGPSGYPSPLTITSTGTIVPTQQGANAIYGRAGLKHARIHNAGVVSGASGSGLANGGTGIEMKSALALTNSGAISGGSVGYVSGAAVYTGGNGVDLLQGGSVTNSGMIAGGAGGDLIDNATTGGSGGIGLNLAAAGTIDNGGLITGGAGGYGYHGGGAGGAGVQLGAGGSLTNTGTISGGMDGQSGFDARAGTGGIGVVLVAGGEVDNTTGTITGGSGQYEGGSGGTAVQMAGGTMLNGGIVIGGAGGFGYLPAGGMGGTGVDLSGAGSLTNTGQITGGAGYYGHFNGGYGGAGVILHGATLTDTGTITGGAGGRGGEGYGGGGGAGVYVDGGTLIVSGTLAGGQGGSSASGGGNNAPAGDAVQFGSVSGTLVIDPGAVFGGKVAGDAGAHDLLDLAAGPTAGTLSGLGRDFTHFATLTLDAGADWTLSRTNTLDRATLLADGGTLSVTGKLSDAGKVAVQAGATLMAAGAGSLLLSGQTALSGGTLQSGTQGTLVIGTTLSGAAAGTITVEGGAALAGYGTLAGVPVLDNGVISAAGGTLVLASAISGSGTLSIGTGDTLTAAHAISGVSIVFSAGAELKLDDPTSVTSTLSGFGSGDVIDLAHLRADSASFSGGTLTLMQGAAVVDRIAFAGSYTTANFALSSDGQSGTDISFVASEAAAEGARGADFSHLVESGSTQPVLPQVDVMFGGWHSGPESVWDILFHQH